MVVGLSPGASYSYDEPQRILTVYRYGVRLQETIRLDTLDERAGRANELLRQLRLPSDR
jgi:hypothetical protein